jgi:transcription-repair coupling factor (superfamily II helicase)
MSFNRSIMLPQTDHAQELLALAASATPLARRLDAVRAREAAVFEHVAEAAQPFLAALVNHAAQRRTWVVCANVRAQEFFYNELVTWRPDAVFLPEMERSPAAGALPDPEIGAERLGVLHRLHSSRKQEIVLVSAASLDEAVPPPSGLKERTLRLARSVRCDRDALLGKLEAAGYERVPQVALRGQYAVRGGIVDVFSWHHEQPLRIELFGDEIDSLREFDLDSQNAVRQLDVCTILLGDAQEKGAILRDYIGAEDVVIDATGEPQPTNSGHPSTPLRFARDDRVGSGVGNAHVIFLEGAANTDAPEDFAGAFFEHGLGEFDAGDLVVHEGRRAQLFRQLDEWLDGGWRVFIFCNNEGEQERLRDILPPEIIASDALILTRGTVTRGFVFPDAKLAVLCDAELFGRYRHALAQRQSPRRMRIAAHRSQIDFSELVEGEAVVHLEHGIGKFLGLQKFAANGRDEEVLALEFAEGARLYVPLEQSFLVSRYVGVGKKHPQLSALGDARWARAKKNAERAAFDYAAKLLSVHAERETSKGFAFAPDNKWQDEFERSFIFKETPDQITAIADTKTDMESERPMDRLICGDVGFGKTEVAIRAAFKAVMNGRQVAILVPTTVLAQQHYNNFRERMSDYPVVVEMLSRFRTQGEQRKIIQRIREGGVDIVVGTHRLISKDVRFKNLGLVVIDEEQRFGVLHKEKFKELFQLVDVLTLSATPIPRTLYLSLMGAKDMSVIETAPPNRIATETIICGYDERVIRDAINRELARQGQVFLLHNRISTIERLAGRVRDLCPEARVETGHGQMDEDELEDVMQRFVAGKTNVLVSTTIIESGLDIPNANTIIIDRADRFGLADLYQLRGRVGRAQHKAYAYLMLPRDMMTVGAARKRVNAIRQYSSLGAGFKIAMRDLEIRGAGNILGTAQSGHIVAIGFDLYCQLLKQAVAKMKGEKVKPRVEVVLRMDFVITNEAEWMAGLPIADCQLPIDAQRRAGAAQSAIGNRQLEITAVTAAPAFLPASYITEPHTRIQAYRRVAEVGTQEQLDKLRKSWRDRFGPLPEASENALVMVEIKLAAAARKIPQVEVRDRKVMITRGGDFVLVGGKFPRLAATDPAAMLREARDLLRSF